VEYKSPDKGAALPQGYSGQLDLVCSAWR